METVGMRVAVDATPALGNTAGIGAFVARHLERLVAVPDVDLTGYALTLRGRGQLSRALPEGAESKWLPYPAGFAREVWQRFDFPALRGFDVVHGTNYVVPPAAGAARIVSVHDMTAWRFPDLTTKDTARYPALVERAINGGAAVHTISHFVANEVMEHFRLEPDRVRTVHLAVDGPEDRPEGDASRGAALAGTDEYILALGTIEPRKDYPGLVQAFTGLSSDRPDLRLVIAGGRGWGAEQLDEAIASAGAERRIVRPGYVTAQEKADLLAGARCLAYPSLYEGFGIPPLEAMVAGVPVVASRSGAVEEVAGEGALLVSPRDADGLAAALDRVLSDDQLRSQLIARGADQVQKFNWDATTAGLVDFYRSVSAGRPQRR